MVLMCSLVWHCSDISENKVQVAVQNMFLKLVALVLPGTTTTVERTSSDGKSQNKTKKQIGRKHTGLCILNMH